MNRLISFLKIDIWVVILCTVFVGCGSLKPVSVTRNGTLQGYKFAYINSTATKVSGTASQYFTNGIGLGISSTTSTNPSEIIAGFLMKKGFIIVPQLNQKDAPQTVVINHAETGRRNLNLGYTIEITIQVLSALDNSLICSGTAEGQGETEADDVRIAINRCLTEMLNKENNQRQ